MHSLTIIAVLLATVGGAQADELKKEDQKQQERVQKPEQIPTTCAIAEYCLGSDGKWRSNVRVPMPIRPTPPPR
jgi:hypothetical protein